MKHCKEFKFLIITFVMSLFMLSSIYAKGWEMINGDWYYRGIDGDLKTESIQASGDNKYYLDENGRMVRDYLLENYNDSIYYFNDDGEMVKNTWVAVDPYQVSDPLPNGPTVYLYYFGASGKAIKADNDIVRKSIDGKKYMFDSQGRMLSGWIDESGVMWNPVDSDEDPFIGYMYYAGDETDGVLRTGWVAYEDGSLTDKYYEKETLWFYFNSSSNKKVFNDTSYDYYEKRISGKTYAFDENGVMLTGWEADKATKFYIDDTSNTDEYGNLSKKRWVYAIPSEEINVDDHIDEVYRWFWADLSGNISKNEMIKVDKNYYAADKTGIIRDGLVVFTKIDHKYVHNIDIENTDGKNFIVNRKYRAKDDNKDYTYDDDSQVIYYFENDETSKSYGKRILENVTIPFSEKDYVFYSTKSVGGVEGAKKRKYYQCGIEMKADPVLGLGLIFDGVATESVANPPTRKPDYKKAAGNEYNVYYDVTNYSKDSLPHMQVVDTSGKIISKSNVFKKDKAGNYWIIGDNGSFMKIVTVPVKYQKADGKWYFKSEVYNDKNMRVETKFIPFGEFDYSNRTVLLERGEGSYELIPDEIYALNFNWAR